MNRCLLFFVAPSEMGLIRACPGLPRTRKGRKFVSSHDLSRSNSKMVKHGMQVLPRSS